jgi:hypothetical protein
VEAGSEKVRCYCADAQTHERCYLIEMVNKTNTKRDVKEVWIRDVKEM